MIACSRPTCLPERVNEMFTDLLLGCSCSLNMEQETEGRGFGKKGKHCPIQYPQKKGKFEQEAEGNRWEKMTNMERCPMDNCQEEMTGHYPMDQSQATTVEREQKEVDGKPEGGGGGKGGVLSNGLLAGGKEGGFVRKKDEVWVGEVEGRHASGCGRVRRANFDDLDAIMDINDNIYDGLDYMPALFYVFMQSKDYAIYVYELDGKLMALRTFYFAPGTEDLVTIMSIRVRPSFKGHGFGRPEQNPIMDQFRKDYPQVTRYIIQTFFKPYVQAKIDKWKILCLWTELTYKLSHDQLLKIVANLGQFKNPCTRPTRISYTKGCEWLNRSDQLLKFLAKYADDYIVAGAVWTAVKIDSTELQRLFTYTNVFVSFDVKDKSSDGEMIVTPEGNEEIVSGEITGFSISSHCHCKLGVNFAIQFYGDSEVDLLSHIYSHVIHYVNVTQDDVSTACSLNFPLSIDSTSVRQHLTEEWGDIVQSEYFSVTKAVQYMAPLGPSASIALSN